MIECCMNKNIQNMIHGFQFVSYYFSAIFFFHIFYVKFYANKKSKYTQPNIFFKRFIWKCVLLLLFYILF